MDRDLNLGFSGGEMKRSELMQLRAQGPDLVLLDEPESGVDLENMALLGRSINNLLGEGRKQRRSRSALIITHTGYILDFVEADRGCVLLDRRLQCVHNPREIFKQIKKVGYQECLKCPIS
jgi:Fe-S cluster assembly ATP-binding protein